ncbi:cholinesterase 2-like [Anneissia japonica]|uniref:cholinesterase 2-like n=1 Tax=Anneissia japonica TaxID=1529436 RepID=UPI0014259BBE|nr:cholinesterase 2-like [Anneissia japonica]
MFPSKYLYLLLLTNTLYQLVASEDVFEVINEGKILGKRINVFNKSVDAFLGIPYAEPPVNDGRFRPPVARLPWLKTLNATDYGFGCMQLPDLTYPDFEGTLMWNPNVELDEDCLNLNVWVPYPRPINAAVMVWIYGGSFYSGVASLDVYDGKTLAAEENIIVVSMNYRLGALGFLAMGDEAPGNAGLLDQALALRWVQDNIARFGGDPDEVTLFSESAGSASVNFHLFSPVSRNLFKRAIMQSASALSPWAYYTKEEGTRRGKMLADGLDCTMSTSGQPFDVDEMVQCMRARDAVDILDQMWITQGEFLNFAFVPVIDGEFITEAPQETINKKSFKSRDIIIGSNTNEANFFVIYEVPGFSLDTDSLLDKTQFRKAIEYCFKPFNEFTHDAIQFQYTDWLEPDNQAKLRDGIDQSAGDYWFVCPTFQLAKAYASLGQTVYYYRFTQRASNSPFPEWMGVLHGDEIAYFFGIPLHPENGFSEVDKKLSRQMMTYYANFARTGIWFYKFCVSELTCNASLLAVDGGTPEQISGGSYSKSITNIDEIEVQWKSEFNEWSTKSMVDWKAEFDEYVNNKNRVCEDS